MPTWRVEVERKVNPDKSSHKIYWEWTALDGTRSQVVPKNKIGQWKLFVDILSPGKALSTFNATENDLAWEKLEDTAENVGYQEKLGQEDFSVDLQNGIIKFQIKRVLTDEGYQPQLRVAYADNDDFISTFIDINLDSTANLKCIGEMFLSAAKRMEGVKT